MKSVGIKEAEQLRKEILEKTLDDNPYFTVYDIHLRDYGYEVVPTKEEQREMLIERAETIKRQKEEEREKELYDEHDIFDIPDSFYASKDLLSASTLAETFYALKEGGDPNYCDGYCTPLERAQTLKQVELLFEAGADIHDRYNLSALRYHMPSEYSSDSDEEKAIRDKLVQEYIKGLHKNHNAEEGREIFSVVDILSDRCQKINDYRNKQDQQMGYYKNKKITDLHTYDIYDQDIDELKSRDIQGHMDFFCNIFSNLDNKTKEEAFLYMMDKAPEVIAEGDHVHTTVEFENEYSSSEKVKISKEEVPASITYDGQKLMWMLPYDVNANILEQLKRRSKDSQTEVVIAELKKAQAKALSEKIHNKHATEESKETGEKETKESKKAPILKAREISNILKSGHKRL